MLKLYLIGALCVMLNGQPLAYANETAGAAQPNWWLIPFWQGATTHGESLLFIQNAPTERPRAALLFPADKILRVEQPSTGLVLEEGKDYVLAPDKHALLLPEGSRIPFKTRDEMYPKHGAPHSIEQRVDGATNLFFGEEHVFHDLQVEVTYTHAPDLWQKQGGYTPEPMGKQLPVTMKKLENREPLKLVLLGDSISAGWNSSALTGARPHMPPYGQLLADGLHARYGGPVEFKNFSVGGKSADWGVQEIEKIAPLKPDLTILAFGMNDASGRVPADLYAARIKTMVNKIRAVNPAAEFILIATMEGNPEWSATSEPLYLAYRDKLAAMTGKGVVLADMTSMWRDLLKVKKFADITGNGVNHPNDFGHRVYAQVLLSLIR